MDSPDRAIIRRDLQILSSLKPHAEQNGGEFSQKPLDSPSIALKILYIWEVLLLICDFYSTGRVSGRYKDLCMRWASTSIACTLKHLLELIPVELVDGKSCAFVPLLLHNHLFDAIAIDI